jgi:hypothetical protein
LRELPHVLVMPDVVAMATLAELAMARRRA